jgi:hypothetical protein
LLQENLPQNVRVHFILLKVMRPAEIIAFCGLNGVMAVHEGGSIYRVRAVHAHSKFVGVGEFFGEESSSYTACRRFITERLVGRLGFSGNLRAHFKCT